MESIKEYWRGLMGYHQISHGPDYIQYTQPMIIRQIIGLYLVIQFFSPISFGLVSGPIMFFGLAFAGNWGGAVAVVLLLPLLVGMYVAVGWAIIDWDKRRVLKLLETQP